MNNKTSIFYKIITCFIILVKLHFTLGQNFYLQHKDHSKSSLQQNDHFNFSCPKGLVQSLHPFVGNCKKFIECFNGQLNIKDCADGTAFDKNILFCDHEYKAKCDHWNTTDSITPQITKILCPPFTNGTYAYPFDGFYYITCSKHEQQQIYKCPDDTIYSAVERKCLSHNIPQINKLNIIDPKEYLDRCPKFPDFQKYFYPYNASKYIQCYKGGMSIKDCDHSKVFSISRKFCLPTIQVLSNDYVQVPQDIIHCTREDFGLYPHPFSNSKYLKCVYGELYAKSCRPGFLYNFANRLCEKNSTKTFKILPPIQYNIEVQSKIEKRGDDSLSFLKCPATLKGTFVHPMDCTKYIECSYAGTKILTCAIGEIYNFQYETCVPQTKIDENYHIECTKHNTSEDVEESFKYYLGVFCPNTGIQLYSHPQNEQKYVLCKNGEQKVKWCPRNQVFSIENRKCINDNINGTL